MCYARIHRNHTSKESSRYQSRFSFQSDKRKVFEGFFFIPRFLFISTRQDFRYATPVTFHENYIYICQKCPPALSFARYDVDKWSISTRYQIEPLVRIMKLFIESLGSSIYTLGLMGGIFVFVKDFALKYGEIYYQ